MRDCACVIVYVSVCGRALVCARACVCVHVRVCARACVHVHAYEITNVAS